MTGSLQLPALFYGQYREVKPRLGKVITRIRRGGDWMELIAAGGFLDVSSTPGLVVLDGPSSLLGGEEHFQAWLFWSLVDFAGRPLSKETEERIFNESLTTPWGTLGMMAAHTWFWARKDRYLPFLRAACTCWDELAAVGPRYTGGSRHPKDLWKQAPTPGYVLANMGVPNEVLNAPLPPGGLIALVRMHGIDLTADLQREDRT